jgi:drug/metabolite transporter (DMT)-like permease
MPRCEKLLTAERSREMNNWYVLSVIAVLLMGTQRFLYKVSAERKCNSAWTTFSFMATVTILSSAFFLGLKEPVANPGYLFLIALLNSGSFVIGTLTHMEALKHLTPSTVYPIIRLNAVIVIVFSIFFFHDQLSLYQGIGIVLAMAVIYILTSQVEDQKPAQGNTKRGLILVSVSLLSGAVASISSKFAAVHTNKMGFMALSYFMGTLFSFSLRKNLETAGTQQTGKDSLVIGIAMGIINFAGFYSFLKALSLGPLSIIVSITGMHFVIAVILSALIYKERLTRLKLLGISLTIVSVIFLRV